MARSLSVRWRARKRKDGDSAWNSANHWDFRARSAICRSTGDIVSRATPRGGRGRTSAQCGVSGLDPASDIGRVAQLRVSNHSTGAANSRATSHNTEFNVLGCSSDIAARCGPHRGLSVSWMCKSPNQVCISKHCGGHTKAGFSLYRPSSALLRCGLALLRPRKFGFGFEFSGFAQEKLSPLSGLTSTSSTTFQPRVTSVLCVVSVLLPEDQTRKCSLASAACSGGMSLFCAAVTM